MPLFTRKPPSLESITASAAQIHLKDKASIEDARHRGSSAEWQTRAWQMYRANSTLRYPVEFIGHALSRLRLVPALIQDSEVVIDEDASLPMQVLEELGSGPHAAGAIEGHSELMRNLGIHQILVGESYLVGRVNEAGENYFEVFSISELKLNGDKYALRKHQSATPEELPDDTFVLRLWWPDAEWAATPDSPIQSLLDTFDELQTLSDALGAIDHSRIPAGILKVPSELARAHNKGFKGLSEDLIEHLSTPISDRRSATSVVPLAVEGKAEFLKELDILQLERQSVDNDIQRMELLLKRIGMGLPLPPEILTGKTNLTHWSGWLIDADTWKAVQPIATLILASLTYGYFRPVLKERGFKDYAKYRIWFDAAELLIRPDQGQAANDGVDRILVSGESWRRVRGFTEEDKPSEEEYDQRAALLSGGAAHTLPDSINVPNIPGPGTASRSGPSSSPPPPPEGEQGPPKTQPALVASADNQLERLSTRLSRIDSTLRRDLAVMGEEAIRQAIKRVGGNVRAKLTKEQARQYKTTDSFHLAATLGARRVLNAHVDDMAGLREGLDSFFSQAEARMKQAQFGSVEDVASILSLDQGSLLQEHEIEMQAAFKEGMSLFRQEVLDQARIALYAQAEPEPEHGEILAAGVLAVAGKLISVIRKAMARIGGGSDQTERPGGIAQGERILSILKKRGIHEQSYVWEHGMPARPLEGHRALDGVEFASWSDPVLTIRPEDVWLARPFYAVGDHGFCTCSFRSIYGRTK